MGIDASSLVNLQSRSAPNDAGCGPTSGLIQGSTVAVLTANYVNSKVISFTMKNFYFGCTARVQTSVQKPVTCTIRVSGTKVGTDLQVGPTFFKFTISATATSAQMVQAVLPPENFDPYQLRMSVESAEVPGVPSEVVTHRYDNFVYDTKERV